MEPDDLKRRMDARGIHPTHTFEVGVFEPSTAQTKHWIGTGCRCTLVEPMPEVAQALREEYGQHEGVEVLECAVSDEPGTVTLALAGASTFLAHLEHTPAIVNDGYAVEQGRTVEVEGVTFDQIDPGDIDLLCIDIEGAEWLLLPRMRSRPRVISIETHAGIYEHKDLGRMQAWARENGYAVWFKTGSDTVWYRRELFQLGLADHLARADREVRNWLQRSRKRLKRRLKRG